MAEHAAMQFLEAVYAHAPPDAWVLVWTLPGKLSRWYRVDALADAAAFAEATRDADLYVGVALSPENLGERRRCPSEQTAGIVALWADIDYAGDVHRKSNLPPDETAVAELLASCGIEPSIVVHSGHGIQAWWLLDEPWIFKNDADRLQASELAARWNVTLRARASERGWVLDATQDLARVMRLPGTFNQKAQPPAPVRIVSMNAERRYAPSDFEPYLLDEAEWRRLSARTAHSVGTLILDPDASPDFDALTALISADQTFRRTWERDRRDLKDDSPSAYDQSLANFGAAIGWSDQQIANLLIAHRRKHGDDLKLRQDYYARTIARARDDSSREISLEVVEGLAEKVDIANQMGNLTDAHHGRRALVEEIATLLGIKCTRFVKFTQDPPRYRMETPTGAITLGAASSILSQPMMRAAIASVDGFVIPVYKTKRWHSIAQAIFSACESEDTGMESTDAGTAYAWLSEYLQDRTVLATRQEAADQQWPYVEEGRLYIFGPPLRKWLYMTRGERVTAPRMGEVLRAFGAEPEVVPVTIRDKRSTRQVWRIGQSSELGIGPMGKVGTVEPGDDETGDTK